ncbi:MAG TPA: nuclear transport factor 2 family protein [Acidimicrobiia bacterium]|nr:nuclear transport factor 2 family protein [Acidimicrobiia bacterium]
MSEANKQVMRDMFAALSAGDAEGFLGRMADDVQWTIQGTTKYSGLYNGTTDAATRLFGGLGAQLEGGLTVVVDDIVAEGDWVVGRGRGVSRTTTGHHYNNEYCWWYRIIDGTVVEIIEYLDTDLVTTVLGT